jgi:hypothetical protein
MNRRVWAMALLLGLAAFALSVARATPVQASKCPNPPACPPTISLLPQPTQTPEETPQETPAATPSPDFSNTQVLSLPEPTSTPPLVPDSGFAESQPVSQSNTAQGAVFEMAPIPKNNDSFAAAPGFGPIGVPLVLGFALLGLISLTVLKRI